MRKNIRILLITASVIITVLAMSACGTGYSLESSHEVDGRQGIAWENGRYYVSGSTSLSVYDAEWNRIKTETEPFGSFDAEVNHIGDVDVYKGEIYAGVEYFMDGVGSNIQMAVYDADSLQLKRTYMFEPDSGQMEVSGIAVDPDHNSMWMCSWIEDESSSAMFLRKSQLFVRFPISRSYCSSSNATREMMPIDPVLYGIAQQISPVSPYCSGPYSGSRTSSTTYVPPSRRMYFRNRS